MFMLYCIYKEGLQMIDTHEVKKRDSHSNTSILKVENRVHRSKSSHLQVMGILLLVLLAVLMMWVNHARSTQAISATVAKVQF